MKQYLLILSVLGSAIAQGQKTCSISEVHLTARETCAGRCTAKQKICGGGTCEVLAGDGTGLVNCICEPGYRQTPAKTLCVPDCSGVLGCNAAGGTCDAPGICNCVNKGLYFQDKKCVSKPECGGDCYGKICNSSGCKCDAKSYDTVNGKCKRKCIGGCDASKGLECVEPGVCACKDKKLNINSEGKCDSVHFVTTTTAKVTTVATTPKTTTAKETTTVATTPKTTPAKETSTVATTPKTTPAKETTPVATTPAPAAVECDICDSMANLELQNKKILALLTM